MALIDRGLLMIDYLQRLGAKDTYKAKYEALANAVDSAPALDVAPVVHAEWIPSSVDPADPYFRCSNCRHGRDNIYFQGDEYNFCPHCGARMDGDADD